MDYSEGVKVVDAVVRFAYNVHFEEFARGVYSASDEDMTEGNPRYGYLLSKFKAMQDNLGAYFGSLDDFHREAFVAAAWFRYQRTR